jgi:hypothetical protein
MYRAHHNFRLSCAARNGEQSDEVINIAGSVNNTMNLDGLATDNVEDEIGFDDQDPIPLFTKFGMSGCSP